MKYRILNISRNKLEERNNAVVTQDGQVAHWDDSAGWVEDDDQSGYEILLVV